MKEYLSQQGIQFEEKDITTDADALKEIANPSGYTAVPTLVIDGEVMVGFDRTRLKKMLS